MNITTIAFQPAPANFDQTGTLYNTQTADLDNGAQLVIAHDVDSSKSSLAYQDEDGNWYDTMSTQDWSTFDALFGRKAWQKFVAEFQDEALAELEELEDEE